MNLVQKLIEHCRINPEAITISQLLSNDSPSSRSFRTFSNQEFLDHVVTLANHLREAGVKSGDNVAILSNTRPEWLIADFAIMFNGAASVSVYQTLTPSEVGYLLYDSNSSVVVVENQEQLNKILPLVDRAIVVPEVEDRPAHQASLNLKKIICIEQVVPCNLTVNLNEILARPNLAKDHFAVEKIPEDQNASIVYTSGTTGLPKGVIQTHGNHLANINQVLNSGILSGFPSLFLFLPLAHSFAKLMGYLGLLTDCSLKFPAIEPASSKFNPDLLVQDIRDADANVFPIVPRILEKVEEKLKTRARRGTVDAKLLALTILSSKRQKDSQLFRSLHLLLTPIRNKIKKGIFGDNFWYVVSGGAKLNSETNLFFDRLGIKVLQGYGLTETCVATNINRLEKNKIGTVGPTLDSSIEIRIAEDQEVLVRGPNVAKGYWRREQATQELWKEEGWFHTGDLGSVDNEGYLSITGRKKEIIVTSYGKKIAPNSIEYRIKASPYIENAVLFGNDRPYIVVLIVVSKVAIAKHLQAQGIALEENYLSQKEVIDLIQIEIDHVNSHLASYEAIKRFTLIDQDFTIENGYLTPTMKVKVSKVYQGFKEKIEALYLAVEKGG